jgi:hypothetical protein
MTELAAAHLTRSQFKIFSEIGDAIRLTEDDRRRALCLTEREWADWVGFLTDGPLPEQPGVPDMLCRLGSVSHLLAMIAEGRQISARTAPC